VLAIENYLSTFFLPLQPARHAVWRERKWTESPVVRDPAFRIFEAGKKEAEIETRVLELPPTCRNFGAEAM
jgi:hypothetical protein